MLLGLVLASCTTSRKFSFEVLWPPKIDVPSEVSQLALINNALLPTDTAPNYYGFQGQLYLDNTPVDTLLTLSALDGLAQSLTESGRFALHPDPLMVPLSDSSERRKPMSFEVLSLIVPAQTDGVAVLESIDAYDQVDYSWGSDDRVYSRLTVLASSSWRLYDLRNRRIVDRWTNMDTLLFYGDGYSVNQALAPLPDRYSALQQVAFLAGSNYGKQIAPFWITVTRECVTDGSSELSLGCQQASKNNWESAAETWQKVSQSKKKGQAAMACHNLAVAAEVLGKLDLALMWNEKSMSIKTLPVAVKHRQQLEQRHEKLSKLLIQFGNKEEGL